MSKTLNQLVQNITEEEVKNLEQLSVKEELQRISQSKEGLKSLATAFYFVRYDFCRLNFVVGARCCSHESLWGGLARNLYEELGGKKGVSHNQLYRDFLVSVDAPGEDDLQEPEFAQQFNFAWDKFCRESSLAEALAAIAIYEIFDVPDYQLLLQVMQEAKVKQTGLHFFQVHAVAQHFEMFEETMTWLFEQEGGEAAFQKAKEFVFQTQTQMWSGLIDHLQEVTQTSLCLV
jgi:pyrroloquinoline quinone (PQQ) biosynthesis protein C